MWRHLTFTHVAVTTGIVIAAVVVCIGKASAVGEPVAHWRFDEGTGTSVTDEIDDIIGNFMTPNPTWTTDVPPVSFGNPYALKFESTGDGVSIVWPSGLNFSGTDNRSFSFWYKPTMNGETASGNFDRIISWTGDAFEIAGTLGNVAVHRMAFYDGSWRDTGFDLTVGNWYNITFTYDGSDVKLFVSGVEKFSGSSGGRDVNGTMYIGVRHTGDEGINGIIDDVRVFDYALTESQIDNIVAGSDNPDSAPAPTLSGALVPADNATGIAVGSNLVMRFSAAVQTGTGTITIKKASDNSTVATINATSGQVTGSGSATITINPSSDLAEGTAYYVQVHANAFKNSSGTFYAGISDTTSWNFTTADNTAPTVSDVSVTVNGSTGATITWATTESGSTKVVYGLTSSYGTSTSETNTSPRVRSHTKTLTGLTACTTYNYSVRSADAFSNTGSSTNATFTTGGCAGDASVRASTGSNVIYNANGSTGSIVLSGTGRSVSLSVPTGYIASNATCPTGAQFQMKELSADPVKTELGAPSGRTTIVMAHNLSAYCPNLTPVTSFDQSLTLTFAYADSDVAGLVESSLGVYRYGSGATSWQELTCTQNTSANTMTCTTTAFSSFGLFGNPVSTSSDSSTRSSSGGGGGGGCRGSNCRSILSKNPLSYKESRNIQRSADTVASSCSVESMPNADGRLFISVDSKPTTFKDVPVTEWFACSVHGVIEQKIFTGYRDVRGNPTGLYGPADSITIGQLAKVAMILAKKSVVGVTIGNDWAFPYMRAAEEMQLSVFVKKPNANAVATRGMVIQTILEVLGNPLEEGDMPYSDVPQGSMYAKAVATATALGIVSGDDGSDTFRPNAPINRAEVAKMIMQAVQIER